MHYRHMTTTLRFRQIAPGRDFHAARVTVSAQAGERGLVHDHDFYELMGVLRGKATHRVAGRPTPLSAGDLVLVRPNDRHAIEVASGRKLEFVNVAFPPTLWESFCSLAGKERHFMSWQMAEMPPLIRLPEPIRSSCATELERILGAFSAFPSRLDLFRLWSAVLPMLLPTTVVTPLTEAQHQPSWLQHALRSVQEADNLRAGLSRFVRLSGVSKGHLARTLKRHHGQTPTGFINELRLTRAAMLLASTSAPIGEIACDCGFENLSYFYRRFRQRFGQTPRLFRLTSGHLVVPRG